MSANENEVTPEQQVSSVPAGEPSIPYYVTNAEGLVVRDGECVESLVQLQAFGAGETVHRGFVPEVEEMSVAVHTHVIPRQMEYPAITEQLDVIWKILAKNPDALGEEGVAMLGRIQGTKDKFPKGQMYQQNMDADDVNGDRFIPVEK